MELTKLISCETLSEHEVLPLLGEFCNQNSTQLTCWNLLPKGIRKIKASDLDDYIYD